MPSKRDGGGSEKRGTTKKLAGAGVAATAVSAVAGVASADGSDSWLFDPSSLGTEDADGFVAVDVAAVREHDDLLKLTEEDVREAWVPDGTATVDEMVEDVADRVDLPVRDAKTVIDGVDVTAEDVDRIAAIGSSEVDAEDRLGGVVVEGDVSGQEIVDSLNQVTEMNASGSGDEYDRWSVSDSDLEGEVVLASGDGRILVGGTGDLDAGAHEVIDQLIDAHAGDADNFAPTSTYSGDILGELSGLPAVAGVEWGYAGKSSDLVPDHAESAVESQGFLADGVSASDFTEGVGALAVGVDPAGPRAVGVVAYDGDAPVSAAEDTLSMLKDEYPDRFSDVDVSVSSSGNLLVVETSTTADHLKDLQAELKYETETASTLRRGVTVSVLPSVKGAAWTVKNYWNSFVENHF